MSKRQIGVVSAASLAVIGLAALAGGLGRVDAPTCVPSHATPIEADTFKIDGGHSSIVYKIEHAGVSNFYGRFNSIEGQFTFDAKAPESASIDVSIKSDSVDSNNTQRDGHLKSPDFFNAKQFATITFKSTSVKPGKDGRFELTGDVTLLGKSKSITAALAHTGEKDLGKPMGHRAGLEATFTIKRSDFGMTYGIDKNMLGDEVAVTISLEGTKQ